LSVWPSTKSLPAVFKRKLRKYYSRRIKALKCQQPQTHSLPIGMRSKTYCFIDLKIRGTTRISEVLGEEISTESRFAFAHAFVSPIVLATITPLDLWRTPQWQVDFECSIGRECDGKFSCVLHTDKYKCAFSREGISVIFQDCIQIRRGTRKSFLVRLRGCYQPSSRPGHHDISIGHISLIVTEGITSGREIIWKPSDFGFDDSFWH